MATIGIIGAGLTGPTAALWLAQSGHDVTVYEQRPSDALHSTGILGITPHVWRALTDAGVNLAASELATPAIYRDVVLDVTAESPFRLIVWTDLHNAITQTAWQAGANFRFQVMPVTPARVKADYVIDAGGIVSAARRKLPSEYIGSVIYRGISTVDTPESFTTYKLPGKAGFLDLGQTHSGAAWAFGVRRPQPAHLRTTFTDIPPREAEQLPAEFRRVVMATPHMMVLPQASWHVAPTMHDAAWRKFSLGDANGPVRPITTSGANLGIIAGMSAPSLMAGNDGLASTLLARRAYALNLGLRLTGPEIGGYVEDPGYDANQRALYGDAS